MIADHRQFAVAVVEQSPAQDPGIHLEVVTSQATLNDDFAKTSGSEDKLVG